MSCYSAKNETLNSCYAPKRYYSNFMILLCNLQLKKLVKFYGIFSNCLKNIVNMHRKPDVSFFQTSTKTSRSMFRSKHRLKIALLRIGKHCIAKTSHC